MGKRFLRSITQDIQTLTASADITPINLPVNPLSFLVLVMTLTIGASQAALNTFRRVQPFFDMITDLSVRHKGESIIQGSLQDLAVLNARVSNVYPWGRENHGVAATIRTMAFPLCFTRRPYWHEEGFPSSKNGELRFHMTAGALPAGFTAAQFSIEAVELIEDDPKQFIKYTTLSKGLTVSGDQDIDLPIGNDLLGILLFDPSDEIDATVSYAFGKVRLKKDNVEQYYGEANWEGIAFDLAGQNSSWSTIWGHRHEQAAADTNTGEEVQLTGDRPPIQYGFLDFDPLYDGSYAVETKGAAKMQLRHNSDVSAGTVRVLPIEWIKRG